MNWTASSFALEWAVRATQTQLEETELRWHLSIYLSLFVEQKDNLNAIGHAVAQDSETKSTEHCPKYKQSTVI